MGVHRCMFGIVCFFAWLQQLQGTHAHFDWPTRSSRRQAQTQAEILPPEAQSPPADPVTVAPGPLDGSAPPAARGDSAISCRLVWSPAAPAPASPSPPPPSSPPLVQQLGPWGPGGGAGGCGNSSDLAKDPGWDRSADLVSGVRQYDLSLSCSCSGEVTQSAEGCYGLGGQLVYSWWTGPPWLPDDYPRREVRLSPDRCNATSCTASLGAQEPPYAQAVCYGAADEELAAVQAGLALKPADAEQGNVTCVAVSYRRYDAGSRLYGKGSTANLTLQGPGTWLGPDGRPLPCAEAAGLPQDRFYNWANTSVLTCTCDAGAGSCFRLARSASFLFTGVPNTASYPNTSGAWTPLRLKPSPADCTSRLCVASTRLAFPSWPAEQPRSPFLFGVALCLGREAAQGYRAPEYPTAPPGSLRCSLSLAGLEDSQAVGAASDSATALPGQQAPHIDVYPPFSPAVDTGRCVVRRDLAQYDSDQGLLPYIHPVSAEAYGATLRLACECSGTAGSINASAASPPSGNASSCYSLARTVSLAAWEGPLWQPGGAEELGPLLFSPSDCTAELCVRQISTARAPYATSLCMATWTYVPEGDDTQEPSAVDPMPYCTLDLYEQYDSSEAAAYPPASGAVQQLSTPDLRSVSVSAAAGSTCWPSPQLTLTGTGTPSVLSPPPLPAGPSPAPLPPGPSPSPLPTSPSPTPPPNSPTVTPLSSPAPTMPLPSSPAPAPAPASPSPAAANPASPIPTTNPDIVIPTLTPMSPTPTPIPSSPSPSPSPTAAPTSPSPMPGAASSPPPPPLNVNRRSAQAAVESGTHANGLDGKRQGRVAGGVGARRLLQQDPAPSPPSPSWWTTSPSPASTQNPTPAVTQSPAYPSPGPPAATPPSASPPPLPSLPSFPSLLPSPSPPAPAAPSPHRGGWGAYARLSCVCASSLGSCYPASRRVAWFYSLQREGELPAAGELASGLSFQPWQCTGGSCVASIHVGPNGSTGASVAPGPPADPRVMFSAALCYRADAYAVPDVGQGSASPSPAPTPAAPSPGPTSKPPAPPPSPPSLPPRPVPASVVAGAQTVTGVVAASFAAAVGVSVATSAIAAAGAVAGAGAGAGAGAAGGAASSQGAAGAGSSAPPLMNMIHHMQFFALTGQAAGPLGESYGQVAGSLGWANMQFGITGIKSRAAAEAAPAAPPVGGTQPQTRRRALQQAGDGESMASTSSVASADDATVYAGGVTPAEKNAYDTLVCVCILFCAAMLLHWLLLRLWDWLPLLRPRPLPELLVFPSPELKLLSATLTSVAGAAGALVAVAADTHRGVAVALAAVTCAYVAVVMMVLAAVVGALVKRLAWYGAWRQQWRLGRRSFRRAAFSFNLGVEATPGLEAGTGTGAPLPISDSASGAGAAGGGPPASLRRSCPLPLAFRRASVEERDRQQELKGTDAPADDVERNGDGGRKSEAVGKGGGKVSFLDRMERWLQSLEAGQWSAAQGGLRAEAMEPLRTRAYVKQGVNLRALLRPVRLGKLLLLPDGVAGASLVGQWNAKDGGGMNTTSGSKGVIELTLTADASCAGNGLSVHVVSHTEAPPSEAVPEQQPANGENTCAEPAHPTASRAVTSSRFVGSRVRMHVEHEAEEGTRREVQEVQRQNSQGPRHDGADAPDPAVAAVDQAGDGEQGLGQDPQEVRAALVTLQLTERYGELLTPYDGDRWVSATFAVPSAAATALAAFLLGLQAGEGVAPGGWAALAATAALLAVKALFAGYVLAVRPHANTLEGGVEGCCAVLEAGVAACLMALQCVEAAAAQRGMLAMEMVVMVLQVLAIFVLTVLPGIISLCRRCGDMVRQRMAARRHRAAGASRTHDPQQGALAEVGQAAAQGPLQLGSDSRHGQ